MIDIILIGHDSHPLLKNCIESVIAQEIAIPQIIYIDNNSKDNSMKFIKNSYPRVKAYEMLENLGYA